MILYHCSSVSPEIVNATPGLIPGTNSWKDWIEELGPATPQEDAIWLTATKSFVGKPALWCYQCVIPSTDRRLVPFKKLLRKAGIDLNAWVKYGISNPALRGWYLYFGTIYPTEVTRIEYTFEDSISPEAQQWFIESCEAGQWQQKAGECAA